MEAFRQGWEYSTNGSERLRSRMSPDLFSPTRRIPMAASDPLPIRAGVYEDFPSADAAVDGLLKAGFTAEEISVVCADETWKRHFANFRHEDKASDHAEEGMAVGSATGAAVGGFAALGVATATGIGLVAAGAMAAVGFAVGSFAGAMSTRGMEGELADFYDQALTGGDILVAVDLPEGTENHIARLERAEDILRDAGAKPIALEEN